MMASLTPPSSAYVIELSKWGIQEGLPNKPYTDHDFLAADATITGINNAIQYAYNQDYTEVILPRGNYALCFPNPIQMASGLTLNLNGSTLKVIYDSDRQSPLDTTDRSVTKDYYKFGGNTIEMNNIEHAHVVNGQLIGDKVDRSFSNPNERAVEWTYGVLLAKGTRFCSVRDCKVSYYMGDNLSIVSSSPAAYAEFSLQLSANDINASNGQLVSSSTALTSKLIDLRKDQQGHNFSTIMVTGFGYSRETALKVKETGFHFYKSDGTYIGGFAHRKIYTEVPIPDNAAQVRLVFYGETNTQASSTSFQITLNYGGLPHHNVFEHNEICFGHRGGITLGGSYNTIQHNVIRDNGQGSTGFLTGNHPFNSTTRYAINQEDSYGDSCIIRDNVIQGSYHGILVGCYSILIEDNHIYNIDNTAINLYALQYAAIKNNYTHNCVNNVGLMNAVLANAHVEITENSFHGGTFKVDASSYQVTVTNNQFEDCSQINIGENSIFAHNIIQFTDQSADTISDMQVKAPVQNSIFIANGKQMNIRLNQYNQTNQTLMQKCRFTNLYIQTQSGKSVFKQCTFSECTVKNLIFNPPSHAVYIEQSNLTNVVLYTGNINTPDAITSLQLHQCTINIDSTSQEALIQSEMNSPLITSIFTLTDCEIMLSNTIHYLYKSLSNGNANITIKDCRFQYTGTNSFSLPLYNNAKDIKAYVIANTTFYNMQPSKESSPVVMWYDPTKKCTGEPSDGYAFTGDLRLEALPVKGGNLGWVCIQEGVASSKPWQANTDYVLGSKIFNGNTVYEAIVSGQSVSTIFTFPGSVQAAISEPDGLAAWKPSTSYQAGTHIRPTNPNGYYLVCTTAGTSGTTEPTWSTWNKVTDGTVTWYPRKAITWKAIAKKASFIPAGIIPV